MELEFAFMRFLWYRYAHKIENYPRKMEDDLGVPRSFLGSYRLKRRIMASNYTDSELTVEPTLEEMLADPMVQLVMERDGIQARDMRGQIDRLQQQYGLTLAAI